MPPDTISDIAADPALVAAVDAAKLALEQAKAQRANIGERIAAAEQDLAATQTEREALAASIAAGAVPDTSAALGLHQRAQAAEASLSVLRDAIAPANRRVDDATWKVTVARREIVLVEIDRLQAAADLSEDRLANARERHGLDLMALDHAKKRLARL